MPRPCVSAVLYARTQSERERETERGACQLFANRKLSNAQNFKRRTFMLMRFESFLITFAPPRTHTLTQTPRQTSMCVGVA